jgi:hypothetical protein
MFEKRQAVGLDRFAQEPRQIAAVVVGKVRGHRAANMVIAVGKRSRVLPAAGFTPSG